MYRNEYLTVNIIIVIDIHKIIKLMNNEYEEMKKGQKNVFLDTFIICLYRNVIIGWKSSI